jgi:hypothetical protein
MRTPPPPYRLELNGEFYGRFFPLPGIKSAITTRLAQGDNPGLFQGFDRRGTLFLEHTGLAFRLIPQPPPRTSPRTARPILVKATSRT